jgi:hypothetical protein
MTHSFKRLCDNGQSCSVNSAIGWRLEVAPIPGGQFAAGLSEGQQASKWFKGAIAVCQPATKRKLLDIADRARRLGTLRRDCPMRWHTPRG